MGYATMAPHLRQRGYGISSKLPTPYTAPKPRSGDSGLLGQMLQSEAARTTQEAQNRALEQAAAAGHPAAARIPRDPAERNRRIIASPKGDRAVRRAFQRAATINRKHKGYQLGGGHGPRPSMNGPWDCSGAVSAVLGVDPRVSGAFTKWGRAGRGKHITVYANGGHVLMEINGRFFGTSRSNPGGGAGWIKRSQISKGYLSGFTARHPAGM